MIEWSNVHRVKAFLAAACFKTAVKYLALSYRRGHRKITVPVTVQGQPSQVTTNLEAAIRQFRNSKNSQVMWIDVLLLYLDRHRTIYRRNLRLGPLFSEWFRLRFNIVLVL